MLLKRSLAQFQKPSTTQLAVAVGVGAIVAIRYLRTWMQRRALPPGRSGIPLLGELGSYMSDTHGFFADRLSQFGGTFLTSLFFKDTVVLKPTPENLKFMASNNNLGWPAHFLEVIGQTAMAMVNGAVHKKQRTIGGRAFTPKLLDSYLPAFQEITKSHLERWSQNNQQREMREDIKFYTFELAQRLLLGVELAEAKTRKMMDLMGTTIDGLAVIFPINLPGFYYRKVMLARKDLVAEYQEVIEAKKASPPAVPCSMIDYVMCVSDKDAERANDVELQDFCVNMTFAGHDTTLATMQTMLHYLGTNPTLMAELREEIEKAWDGKAAITRALFEKVPKCRAFLMETSRLMPPVPFIARDLSAPATVDGYDLPAGMCVMLGLKSIMDHTVQAEGGYVSKMNLAHWLDKDGHFTGDKKLYDFASFSIFGTGGRMCVGYKFALDELLVFLLNLLHGYEFTVTKSEKNVFPFAFMRVTAGFRKRN